MATAIIRTAGEGDQRSFLGGGLHTWKLMAEDTDGACFVFEDVMARAKTTPWHRHPEADEMVFVLEGTIVVNIDGKESELGPGGMTFTPRGVPHAFMVISDSARLLTMQSPGIGQSFYRDASDPAADDTPDNVDLARVRASASGNPRGIELLGPPPFANAGAAAAH